LWAAYPYRDGASGETPLAFAQNLKLRLEECGRPQTSTLTPSFYRWFRPGRCPDFGRGYPDTVRRWSAIGDKKCFRKPRTGGRCPVMGLLLSEDSPPPRASRLASVSEFLLQPVRPFLLPLQLLPERGLRGRLKLSLSLQAPKLAL